MGRDEHDVPRLQPQIPGGVATQEVVVHVESSNFLATPANGDRTQRAVVARPSSSVQRRHYRAGAGDAVTPGAHHIPNYKDLIATQLRDRHLEMRGRAGALLDSRIDAAESGVEHLLQLRDGQVRDGDLTDLRNQDEPLARDIEGLGGLNFARQNENESIARAKSVVRIHWPIEVRLELALG